MLYELYEKFLSKGKGAGWLAVKDGVYIAGLVTVYSPHVSHALLGGSKEEYLQVPANDLLLHNAILDAMRKGKRFFDFMCSSSDKQLRFYKEKFGTFEYPACFFEMDVDAFRAKIWDILWKIAHSKAGGKVARLITR